MIVDMQGSLEDTMKQREEAELQVRQMSVKVEELENRLKDMDKMEDQVEQLNVTLVSLVAEKSKLEVEIGKMRDAREEAESRETVLSNRLNEAKKKEGVKANMVQKLDFENTEMQDEIVRLKQEVTQMTLSRDRLETGMEKLKKKCVERVKMAEGALEEERHLNDERKKKMKFFLETKAEELRVTKEEGDAFRTELEETRVSLRDTTNKLERMHTEWMSTQTRNRELQREMMTLRKSSNKLYKMGGNLELELEKSTQETEEHKNKRLTAKHELITLLRTLEGERSVTGKLRDSLKFTFTPKALSQQQLLVETLRDFEEGLTKLSRRLGKPLPPSSHQGIQSEEFGSNVLDAGVADMTNPENSTIDPEAIGSDKSNKKRNKADADSTRLVSSLERETQQVSQGIMALISNVERLHTLLSDAGDRNCMSVLNDFLATAQYNQTEGNNSNIIRRGNDDDQGNEESFNSFSNNVAGPRRFSRQPQYGPL
jgi:chromosome segregation ATPase